MNIAARTKICMVIGDPVEHSLSPKMHNAGYKALGIDNEFVYVGAHVKPENLPDFTKGIKAMQIRGVSVTIPHKQEIMKYLDEIDETAKKIGAVNTIVNNNGILKGFNTDWIGVYKPLKNTSNLKKNKAIIIGAGGAAKSAVYALLKIGVKRVGIYNRTFEKAKSISAQFNIEPVIDLIEHKKNTDIIINATSLGLSKEDELPVPIEYINRNQIVFDLVYTSHGKTRLIKEAEKKGAKTITGIEMLLHQGFEQFKLFTGHDAPEDAMRKALL